MLSLVIILIAMIMCKMIGNEGMFTTYFILFWPYLIVLIVSRALLLLKERVRGD